MPGPFASLAGWNCWTRLSTHPKPASGTPSSTPKFTDKAAVLVVRITRNHPRPHGNKRLAWQSLTMFCALNDHELDVPPDEAVSTMLAISAGELDEVAIAAWLTDQLDTNTP
ncbi:MAG: hypothetical protein GY788_25535 [bacterium]|nr:hypothetical protein [bacterium]